MVQKHAWLVLLAVLGVSATVLREALLPFVAGAAVAYVLNPLVIRLERLGVSRLGAALGIFAVIGVVMAGLLGVAGPIVVSEISYLVERAPSYFRQLQEFTTGNPDRPWLARIVGDGLGQAERAVSEVSSAAVNSIETFLGSAWAGGEELISALSVLIVVPVVAAYFVKDWDRITTFLDRCVPAANKDTVRALAREINDKISGFMVGQATLCLVLAVFYATSLSLIGLNHGLIVGFGAGLLSFVPYLGFLVGLVVATLIALAQYWPSWLLVLQVPAIFLVGQTIADYVLSPYLLGRRVELGPVWVMFSLFAFGKLFGIFGLLVAVPLAAAIGVIFRFLTKKYLGGSESEGKIQESASAPAPGPMA
ncbi:MAG: AI-2E family transporter [Methylacidiphilales bacterium]|nr:AI-2E family transporter [Candidatus Methylacidiphilales bacterium]